MNLAQNATLSGVRTGHSFILVEFGYGGRGSTFAIPLNSCVGASAWRLAET